MTMIFVLSLCWGRGAGAGVVLASGGALASGLAPTSGPAPLEGTVSPEGGGGPLRECFPLEYFRVSRSAASGEYRRPISPWKPPPQPLYRRCCL